MIRLSGYGGTAVLALPDQWFRPVSSAGQIVPAAYGPINDPCARPGRTPQAKNSKARRFSPRRQIMGRLQ